VTELTTFTDHEIEVWELLEDLANTDPDVTQSPKKDRFNKLKERAVWKLDDKTRNLETRLSLDIHIVGVFFGSLNERRLEHARQLRTVVDKIFKDYEKEIKELLGSSPTASD